MCTLHIFFSLEFQAVSIEISWSQRRFCGILCYFFPWETQSKGNIILFIYLYR